jgi:hypothetical protein
MRIRSPMLLARIMFSGHGADIEQLLPVAQKSEGFHCCETPPISAHFGHSRA